MNNATQNEIRAKKLTANSKQQKAESGFTLIEVMIAMAIFTIVVTIGIGAVLDTITQHRNTENARGVMDNLNFIMEDMARNIRLGTDIHCALATDGVYVDPTTGAITPQNCPGTFGAVGSNKIIFKDLTRRKNITYTISAPIGTTPSQIYKQIDDTSSGSLVLGVPELITSTNVKMDFQLSGFTVRGAEPTTLGTGDQAQPTVVIRLAGVMTYKGIDTKFAIQTTTAIRPLDS